MAGIAVMGRPGSFTPELAKEICDRLECGETLISICQSENMPNISTIMDWSKGETQLSKEFDFPAMYARARHAQLVRMAEEMLSIADDGTNDWMEREIKGGTVVLLDREHVARSDLRLKTRQWLLARLDPQTYSDRLAHQMLDEKGKPAKLEITVTRVEPPK